MRRKKEWEENRWMDVQGKEKVYDVIIVCLILYVVCTVRCEYSCVCMHMLLCVIAISSLIMIMRCVYEGRVEEGRYRNKRKREMYRYRDPILHSQCVTFSSSSVFPFPCSISLSPLSYLSLALIIVNVWIGTKRFHSSSLYNCTRYTIHSHIHTFNYIHIYHISIYYTIR